MTKSEQPNPAETMKDPRKFFIVDTKTKANNYEGRDWKEIDVSKNQMYRDILEMDPTKLAERYPHLPWNIKTKAQNFHKVEHLLNTEVYKTELEGLIFIDTEEDAKRILKLLQVKDPEIKLSVLGKQFAK